MYALKAKTGFYILKLLLKRKRAAGTVKESQSLKHLLPHSLQKRFADPDVNNLLLMSCLFLIKEMCEDSEFELPAFKSQSITISFI